MLSVNKQDKDIGNYLHKIGVKYDVSHTAEMLHDKEWQHDLFYAVFQGNKTVAGFEYKTGIGHRVNPNQPRSGLISRKLSRTQMQEKKKLDEVIGKSSTIPAKHATNKKPVSAEWVVLPTQASVLYGLILDASANDESFPGWCDNYGYDADSLKALNIYNACIENAKKLHSVFTREQIEHLQELLEDY